VTVALFLMAFLRPGTAAAQGPVGPNELTVFGGVSLANPRTDDPDRPIVLDRADARLVPAPYLQSASLGGSAEFGARYDRYLTDVISVGGDFSIAPSHRYTERIGFGCPDGRLCILAPERQIETTVVAYHYGGNVGFDLARGALRPSIVAGIGGVTYDGDRGLGDTHVAVRVGGALRADAGRVTLRLEAIDVITPDHFVTGQSEHDVHVRVGVAVRW